MIARRFALVLAAAALTAYATLTYLGSISILTLLSALTFVAAAGYAGNWPVRVLLFLTALVPASAVVISAVNWTISTHLARNGYIVAMLEHSGNNRTNNELAETDKNLTFRTRHIRLTLDAVSHDPWFQSSIQPDNAAIIGHSIGGTTALAVAGGIPWSRNRQKIEVESDSRVKALVLLAPATDFYLASDSLRDVKVPILMFFGSKDYLALHCQPEVVLNGVAERTQVTSRIVENAGHFSFISPFPPQMKNPGFPPSNDPDGFDREKFHEKLPGELLQYLDKKLKAS